MMSETEGTAKAQNRAGKPKITVAELLTRQIENLAKNGEKTQREIAAEIGYDKPNMITMFKQGATNLPINKVRAMAKAIHLDPAYLLRVALTEYMPDAYEIIEESFADAMALSENEKALIRLIRAETGNSDPAFDTAVRIANLKEMLAKL